MATICLVAAIVSSLSMAYWFSLWNSLSIVVGGCSESESKNWVLGRMTCFICLQDSVKAYGFELEDRGPKTLHKISDELGLPHPGVEETGDALFPLD